MPATGILALALVVGSPKVLPTGYVEAYYAYNFARPSNRITNHRGYDNRSNTFSLTNAVIGTAWESGDVTGKVVLQIGSTASTEEHPRSTRRGPTSGSSSKRRT
jgi:hypothetical protein